VSTGGERVSGEAEERETKDAPGSGGGKGGDKGSRTPGGPGGEAQAEAAALGEVLDLQCRGKALGTFHGGEENGDHPGGKSAEAEREGAVVEGDPPRFQGKPETAALFENDGEELKAKIEDENKIRYRKARPGEGRKDPAEAAGKLERGGGSHEMGGNEYDRRETGKDEE